MASIAFWLGCAAAAREGEGGFPLRAFQALFEARRDPHVRGPCWKRDALQQGSLAKSFLHP